MAALEPQTFENWSSTVILKPQPSFQLYILAKRREWEHCDVMAHFAYTHYTVSQESHLYVTHTQKKSTQKY